MRRFEAGLLCCLCVATLLLQARAFPAGNTSRYGEPCSIDNIDADGCGPFETCKQESDSAKCACQKGFVYQKMQLQCVGIVSTTASTLNTPESGSREQNVPEPEEGSSLAAILLVPICLIIIGVLTYFGARRYKWVQRFRQFRQNRYGSVLVTRDDTDDDDPPLS